MTPANPVERAVTAAIENPPLPADEEHGFAEGVFETNTFVRCPYGCDKLWDKRVHDFLAFYYHLQENHAD